MTHRDELIANIAGQIAAGIITRGQNPHTEANQIEIARSSTRIAEKILLAADSGATDEQEAAPEPLAEPMKVQLTKALEEMAKLQAANWECSRLASVEATKRHELERDIIELVGPVGAMVTLAGHDFIPFFNFLAKHPHLKPES